MASPLPESWLAASAGPSPLITVSRTGEMAPDSGIRIGRLVHPDLQIRTLVHWPATLL